ncbi:MULTISPECIES: replication protein C, IncQ-type [Aeromonas]|uniref:replication protein C, IncQ-type n=1 Tax=Aeromonas TaxID=642 RepID=UPI0013A6ABB9|nr:MULTISPECIES: replication protein C, IncQ-type [Aeromonas]MDM5126078.1 replication protein C, IncQ-type [Aeromonas salmonicida]
MNSSTDKTSKIIFAQHDPVTAMAQLFRPLVNGDRRGSINIEVPHLGNTYKFTCFELLDVVDQSILLGIVGIAALQNSDIHARMSGAVGKALWNDLQPSDDASEERGIVFETTRREILLAAGLSDAGDNYGRLADSLYRLSQVGCRVKKEKEDWGMNLLSYRLIKNPGCDHIHIAMNSRFASALMEGQKVIINLAERRMLAGDVTQLLHARLSAQIHRNQWSPLTRIDTLIIKIWCEEENTYDTSTSTHRRRRMLVRDALEQLIALGWMVKNNGSAGVREMVQIKKPIKKSPHQRVSRI